MKITVKLIGPFVQAAGFSEKTFDVPAGTTLDELVGQVGLDKGRPKIVTRNGAAVGPAEPVAESDRIVIAPIYSGG
jgi:molybdopterin converting factor small subunit